VSDDTAINNLRQAVINAAGGDPFALDSAFLTTGLNDSSVNVPADYDTDIVAAFQLSAATAFLVSASAGNVGQVQNGSFQVTNATIPFISGGSVPLKAGATLVFTVTTDANPTLVVQVATSPSSWTWTDSFTFMGGWPFNQLNVGNALFIFSTADGTYPWTNSSGADVKGGAKQNFSATIPVPATVTTFLPLFSGLSAPATAVLAGVLDLSTYDATTVLLPPGTLTATLQNGQFQFFYLSVSDPSIGIEITAPAKDDTESDQSAQFTISALLGVGDIKPEDSPYILQIQISPPPDGGAVDYSVGMNATGQGTPLTPDSMISLIGGGGSFFSGTPSVLQEFLAFIALQGLTITGTLNPATVGQISILIGSMPGTSWTPIPNPPPGLDFSIESFSLQWSMSNPLNASRQQSFFFQTEFILMPSIFKGPGGEGDGVFTVEFDSALNFSAMFAGTVSLSDFLGTLSGGAISLPPSIEASLSDISLTVNFNAKSFTLSASFDVSLSFLTVGGYPILSITDGGVNVSAMTPPQGNSEQALVHNRAMMLRGLPMAANSTVWSGSVGGVLGVGPFSANVLVAYDGTLAVPQWHLSARLARPLNVQDLIKQFFAAGGVYDLPDFLPGSLTITTFGIDATIPTGNNPNAATKYQVDVSFSWIFKIGDYNLGLNPATIKLLYDGSQPSGQQFTGSVAATWIYDAINLELLLTYSLNYVQGVANQTLSLEWEGFTASYSSGDNSITFSLKGWSIGSLIQALVRTLGDPYFTLPSPWDLLNQISLDGLQVIVSLQDGLAFSQRLSAKYTLSSPLNLGFITINSIIFRRTTPDGKVTIAIDGSSPIASSFGDLMDPAKGQDTQNLPPVPGRGNSYFKVFLLVLGQKVGITGSSSFANTQAVITALQNVPSTTGKLNPVDPNQGGTSGLPYYNASNNWLIAAHLGLLQVAGVWTVDAMLVFNDPNLYGCRLALNGPKAGGLDGLAIDILYKKITDDIGLFQINFTFPTSIRNINMGAVSITLPQIGIQIYTNGDFLIDIGFPYNLDFSRSFAIYAIIYGVPVMGAGGFYFGKLSSATATQVPKTTKGTFDPVIVFGIGLQLGLGYNFTEGPLSAGFSLTVFGIVEGVIAAWHPYPGNEMLPMQTALGTALQSDYYFKISGTVGVIGLLYGKIDFGIISASLNVKITLSLQITYESFRAIPLIATATVDVSLTVKINLGLFSISISFSFHMTVSAKFVIGSDSTAPWDGSSSLPRMRTALLHEGPDAVHARAALLQPRQKKVVRGVGVTAPTLNVLASPQFTVLAPEDATDPKQQQGAFVYVTAMDAPTATGTSTGNTSFDQLCAVFFPWVIDTLSNSQGDEVDLDEVATTVVTRTNLEDYVAKLADLANPPLDMEGLLKFMASSFILNIESPAYAKSSGDQALFQKGASAFPVFDGISLTVPDPAGGSGTKPITFQTYATATSTYRQTVASTFAKVEAQIETQNQSNGPRFKNAPDDPESMAALIFIDYFSMIGRQLLQAARNLMDGYAYPLQPKDSIATIIDTADGFGNELQVEDVAVPNQDHQLTPTNPILLPSLSYSFQATDTLNSISGLFSDSGSTPRWTTTPAQLILANGTARIIQAGVGFTYNSNPYETTPGASFQSIATDLGISLQDLSQLTLLYTLTGFLSPSQEMTIPSITYMTGSSDTLSSVAKQFATTVPLLATASIEVPSLFSTTAENGLITLANLQSWNVAGLWTAIQATDQVAQTAGMVSRFLMYGLRLPNAEGLSLSSEFLFPTDQSAYALYQLTGQEFRTPAPAAMSSFPITVTAATSSHGVSLSFIEFNGAPGSSVPIDLTAPYGTLSNVLNWAQAGNFQPSPSFTPLPQSLLQPKQFAANNYSYWTTSDLSGLESLTNRGANATDGSNGQIQPTLWPLPSSLLSLTEARQAALAPLFTSMSDLLPLLPQFQPQRGQTSPAGQQTEYSDLNNWAWTTRVDFQIKRLPVFGASSGGADDTPNGPASAPSLPNAYEVIGASTEGAQTLELLLRSMDSLGEDIVSDLFVMYPQSGSSVSLNTLGSSEFLAFMTQTNLSTETNPVRSAVHALAQLGSSPRGIANSPGEFIKLLWELSVVRSGGYFFFYQVIDGGGGFPSSIFDSSGTATLSLVVTFTAQGSTSFGETAPAFVNSFVTTDNLNPATDVVQLVSLPTSGESLPATGATTETLASLSALYGSGPGSIVELNPTVPLTANSVIPINGIVRQLRQADLTNPSQTLANLATYYSQGAQTPITAADIQNFNPGVQVVLGAVFYIPQINYVVNSGSPPGNTFGKIASYYGISANAMAVNALNVGGLFPASTVLDIDTQVFDLRSALGPGNVSFEMERTNYGPPSDDPTDPNYPRDYMYTQYNTLSAGFLPNAFTKPNAPMGLPFGPQIFNDEKEAVFASHARRLESTRVNLTAVTLDDFQYRQSLGITNFAKINAAPANPVAGLPPQSANPYVNVGATNQIALQWQDVYGNTTLTPFTAPGSTYNGALNGSAITVLYSDRLVGLSGWTSTLANYIYSGNAGSPTVNLNLKFDTKPYQNNPDQAKRDLALYTKIYFQLNQEYTGLGVPGVTGNAVTMSVSNSVLASPVTPLTEAQAKQIRAYINNCVEYLSAVSEGNNTILPLVPTAVVSIPVSTSNVAAGNILELDLELILNRNPLLTDPEVAALADGLSVSGTVLPTPDVASTPGEQPAYVGFATAFETAFQTTNWYMKVGEGMKLQSDSGDNNTALQLWAVRFGTSSGQGIYFEIVEDQPSYCSPKPVATTLTSRTVQITDYATNKPVTVSFNGVDQNQWFQTTLDAIDTFLSASDSTSAFILDKLNGVDDPLTDGNLGKVLSAKESLADSISSAATAILSTSQSDPSTKYFAQEKLRQQFLNRIGAAYAAGAAVVYQLNKVSGFAGNGPAGPPNLYGQPSGKIPGSSNSDNQNFTLSATRIPLGPTSVDQNTYDPRLSFIFTTKNIASQAYVPLNLSLDITHLEFDRTLAPGIDGYVQSQWLVFINGPFAYNLNTDAIANIPVVNRNLPTPPTVQQQTAEQNYYSPATGQQQPATIPQELTSWTYSFEYLYRFAAQDTVQTAIQLNVPPPPPPKFNLATTPDLFTALAQFVTAYPLILADFSQYLAKINAKTTDQTIITGATNAVNAFQTYLNDVATAYAASLMPTVAEFVAPPQLIEIDFETALDTDPGTSGARTDILNLTINKLPATYDPQAGTISNGTITLPVMVVAIAPDQYTAVPPPTNPPAYPAYVYQLNGSKPATYMSYNEALNNPMRTVLLPDLNVLLHQNGVATISVDRNKILFPVGSDIITNPDFIFTTPLVSFANPVVPRLSYGNFSLDEGQGSGETLEQLLNAFFAALFTGGDGTVTIEAGMTGSYGYNLPTGFPIGVPVCLLPPAETPVDPGTVPTFIPTLAGAVGTWISNQHPTTDGDAQVQFRMNVFGSQEKQPLILVDDLYHSVSSD
jgi:hypothetical protein